MGQNFQSCCNLPTQQNQKRQHNIENEIKIQISTQRQSSMNIIISDDYTDETDSYEGYEWPARCRECKYLYQPFSGDESTCNDCYHKFRDRLIQHRHIYQNSINIQ